MSSPPSYPPAPAHLFEAFERAGDLYPHRSVSLLDNRGRLSERRSFADVHAAALDAAARYRALGLEPGDRVLVSLPTSWDWIDSWLGAAFAGALPAAIAPPGALGSPAAQVKRSLEACELLGARLFVTGPSVIEEAAQHHPSAIETRLLDVAELRATTPASGAGPALAPDPEEIAFHQLTSGSTGSSRVVRISHRAAIHNARMNTIFVSEPHGSPSQTMISWLPLYHDMGLVGSILNSVVNGLELVLLNPRTFLARPWIWLEVISRYRDVLSPAPNFAYRLVAERTADRDLSGLDLSGWRDAMCGSEMIRPETMDLFRDTFAPCGLDPRALRPCYGLAEATLSVTFDSRLEGVRTRPVPAAAAGEGLTEVVSNGVPVHDTRVEIRGANGAALPPSEVGEVWVHGPGVMSGYFRDEEATAACLVDGWLDTGDLGFLDPDGELYVTGRSKEILILMGENIMPHEIEWVAEGAIGAGGGQRSGAFSVPASEGEKAVLVVEVTERDPERLAELRRAISVAVGRSLSLPLAELVLVRRGSIPRTSSGKVQRRELKQRYLRQELSALDRDASRR